MRIRSLKPGFFKNEELAELSPWHRLCYEGLWCCADREGRMQDRPKRLKAEIFPYDELNIDLLLWDLSRSGFIVRYVIGSQPLICIPSFDAHQHPRQDEAVSVLAAFSPGTERLVESLDTTTFPAFRPIDTDPSLSSHGSAVGARIVTGVLGLGSGVLGNGHSVADATRETTRREEFRAQDLIDLWNATTKPPLPRCRELTEERRRKIRSRIAKRPSLTDWREAFEAIQSNAFYRGEGSRGWIADFDWTIKNDTIVAKVLERRQTSTDAAVCYEWQCPHEPACLARRACEVKTQLETARKARQA